MQKKATCYPVLIPTLNRYEHFKRCVESLAKNLHADKTELVIGLDYPPSDKYVEGYLKIKKYIPAITGFAKITIIEHETNVGAGGNLSSLRKYAHKYYDASISTEDDNEFAPSFLDFINKALNFYFNESSVKAICGYTSIEFENLKNEGILYTHDNCAWGIGVWKHKENGIYEMDYYNTIWKSSFNFWMLFFKSPSEAIMFAQMMCKNEKWGDVMRTVQNIMKDTYQVKPFKSLVRNWGFDGSGLHCTDINESMSKQEMLMAQSWDFNFSCEVKNSIPFYQEFLFLLPKNNFSACRKVIKLMLSCLKIRLKYLRIL